MGVPALFTESVKVTSVRTFKHNTNTHHPYVYVTLERDGTLDDVFSTEQSAINYCVSKLSPFGGHIHVKEEGDLITISNMYTWMSINKVELK